MDVTANFKSCVQAKREVDKFMGVKRKPDILKNKRGSEYIRKFKNLLSEISSLRDFLLEHRKAYLNLSPEFVKSDQMSEVERDKIDFGAQKIIQTCSQMLMSFKKELYNMDENQEVENNKAIVDLLGDYLKSVCKIYTEQKAIRVKWTIEVEKLSKLEDKVQSRNEATSNREDNWVLKEDMVKLKDRSNEPRIAPSDYAFQEDDNPLSEEELQMFEMENQQLYSDLNSLNDEVKAIQSNVVKIAELQEVFTDKVLEQNEEIERISTTLVGTTENVKDANVQIRQAIQNNASFRIYVLIFILVMSFSLLFLDWYND
ncbi:syntaxin-18 [Cimex lectularius]|uniref:Syntaxin-18 n=1 Tax=Cimex lectularius TaxID=79782 RepID=A0A8I6RW54_CIMLE|nr:syntaxin-18 [Cimex lectularius]